MKASKIIEMINGLVNNPKIKSVKITGWESREDYEGDFDSTSISHLPILEIEKFEDNKLDV